VTDTQSLSLLRKKRASIDKAIRALERFQQLHADVAENNWDRVVEISQGSVLPWINHAEARLKK
jgi:phage-related minor tail protein